MTHEQNLDQPLGPEQRGRELAEAKLAAFISSPAHDALANLFGVTELPAGQAERLAAMQAIAAEHWDFRKGAERQATDWNDELLDQADSAQWQTVFEAADKFGLVESSSPENKHPDYLVVLGGANKAPLDRLRFALERTENHGHVVYLGSSREIKDAEREKAKGYAPHAQTEFDLGCGAFATLLNARLIAEENQERNGDIWGMRLYEYEHAGEIKQGFVLSTPQVIGKRRASTYDNYKFFAGRAELAENPETSVVAVTTGFYVQGQGLPAVTELTLPFGINVETIGHDAAYSGVTRKPSQLLQEIKAGIDAAVKLEKALHS